MGVEVENYTATERTFSHNPEPLKEHLTDISELVVEEKADLGIVVDPDVDRSGFHLRRWRNVWRRYNFGGLCPPCFGQNSWKYRFLHCCLHVLCVT